MTLKEKTQAHCIATLTGKIALLEKILQELSQSAASATKSSAGDKHETGRAMVQLEQENNGKQLQELQQQRNVLESIDPTIACTQIMRGALAKTNRGYLYISIPLGKMTVDGNTVLAISAQSPLGIKMMGLQEKESTSIDNVDYRIEEIY